MPDVYSLISPSNGKFHELGRRSYATLMQEAAYSHHNSSLFRSLQKQKVGGTAPLPCMGYSGRYKLSTFRGHTSLKHLEKVASLGMRCSKKAF